MKAKEKSIVITSALRTAIGTFNGTLKNMQGHDLGSIVVKENVKYEEVNVSNSSQPKMKKCLVLEAHGDLYKEKEPKGLKLKSKKKHEYVYSESAKRVGACVRTKLLLGPGTYEARVKFTSSKVLNAIWTFQYEEFDMDDHRQ